jgi:cytochrome c oxidase subunit 4
MSGHSSHHIIQPSTYIKILFVLMFFMGLTILAAKWPALEFGILTNLIIALAIAFGKVYFIMSYFMHVKFSSPLVRTVAIIGFLFLIIMFTLTFNDYLGRDHWHSSFRPSPFADDQALNPPPAH